MFKTLLAKFRNISIISFILPFKFINNNNNLICGVRNGSINSSNNIMNNDNFRSKLFYSTYTRDSNSGDDGKKIMILNINDPIINDSKECNKQLRENIIIRNYNKILKLFQGFTNDYVLIGGVKYKKINIVKVVLEHDSNNKNSNYLIQQYLLYHGKNSIKLSNGEVIVSDNKLEYININSINHDIDSYKKGMINDIIVKIEKYYIGLTKSNTPLSISSLSLSPSDASLLFNLYKELFNILNENYEFKLHGIKMKKMEFGYQLAKENGIPSIDLLFNFETFTIKHESNMDDDSFKNKSIWVKSIESIQNESLCQGILSVYYYNLSLQLTRFDNITVQVNGNPMSKLDLLLKSYTLNNENHYAKKWIATYLIVSGKPSITLSNKKVLKLNKNNDVIEDAAV